MYCLPHRVAWRKHDIPPLFVPLNLYGSLFLPSDSSWCSRYIFSRTWFSRAWWGKHVCNQPPLNTLKRGGGKDSQRQSFILSTCLAAGNENRPVRRGPEGREPWEWACVCLSYTGWICIRQCCHCKLNSGRQWQKCGTGIRVKSKIRNAKLNCSRTTSKLQLLSSWRPRYCAVRHGQGEWMQAGLLVTDRYTSQSFHHHELMAIRVFSTTYGHIRIWTQLKAWSHPQPWQGS